MEYPDSPYIDIPEDYDDDRADRAAERYESDLYRQGE